MQYLPLPCLTTGTLEKSLMAITRSHDGSRLLPHQLHSVRQHLHQVRVSWLQSVSFTDRAPVIFHGPGLLLMCFFFEVPLEAGKVHILVGGFTLFICDEVLPNWLNPRTDTWPGSQQIPSTAANRPSLYRCYSYWNAKYQKDTWVWDGENYGEN